MNHKKKALSAIAVTPNNLTFRGSSGRTCALGDATMCSSSNTPFFRIFRRGVVGGFAFLLSAVRIFNTYELPGIFLPVGGVLVRHQGHLFPRRRLLVPRRSAPASPEEWGAARRRLGPEQAAAADDEPP